MTAGDTHALCRLMAAHLQCAQQLLAATDVTQRATGFAVVYAVTECALERLQDYPLALQICQAYLLPNLSAGPPEEWRYVSKVGALFLAVKSLTNSTDTASLVAIYQQIIRMTTNNNTADTVRVQLAYALDKLGKPADAIASLDAIVDPAFKASTTVATLRQQLAQKIGK